MSYYEAAEGNSWSNERADREKCRAEFNAAVVAARAAGIKVKLSGNLIPQSIIDEFKPEADTVAPAVLTDAERDYIADLVADQGVRVTDPVAAADIERRVVLDLGGPEDDRDDNEGGIDAEPKASAFDPDEPAAAAPRVILLEQPDAIDVDQVLADCLALVRLVNTFAMDMPECINAAAGRLLPQLEAIAEA